MIIKSALIVDDSKMARITLKKQLASRDITATMAESGEDCLESLKKDRPDVIFMDCLMPGIDGFEATRQILADPDTASIPVVMCTGKESDEDKEKALELGALGYMSKSSSTDGLDDMLDMLGKMEQPMLVDAPTEQAEAPASTADIDMGEITRIAEQAARQIAEQISREIVTPIAETAAEKISVDQISLAITQQSEEFNKKIAALTEQFETNVRTIAKETVHSSLEDTQKAINQNHDAIDSTHKSVENIHNSIENIHNSVENMHISIENMHNTIDRVNGSIDTQINTINNNKLPELRDNILNSVSTSLEGNKQQLLQDIEKLKTEFNPSQINKMVEQQSIQQLNDNFPTLLSSLMPSLIPSLIPKVLESEATNDYVNSVVENRLVRQKAKLDELEEKAESQANSGSNTIGWMALVLGTGAFVLSVYQYVLANF